MKTVLTFKPWLQDPALIPLPWRDEEFNFSASGGRKLKVGVMWSDGIVKPHPPIQRALQEVVNGLMNVKGIEVVQWEPYKHDLAWEIVVCILIRCCPLIKLCSYVIRPVSTTLTPAKRRAKSLTLLVNRGGLFLGLYSPIIHTSSLAVPARPSNLRTLWRNIDSNICKVCTTSLIMHVPRR